MMLLYKAWRESRLGFVLSLTALAAICTLFCLFPRGDLQHKYTFTQTMYLVTYAGVLRNIFIVLTLLLGLGGFLRERSYGTLAYTLALPVRRSRFIAARAVVGFAELSALALIPAVLVPMFSRWSHQPYPSIPQALHFSVLWMVCGTMFFAFGLLLSTFVPGDYPAAATCLISLFAYLMVLEFAPLEKFPSLDLFNVIAAWHMPYFSGRDTCFVTYLPWRTLSVITLLAVITISVAGQIVERQDF
jgi:ABC-type transport system involved in multi-copper enzyme maturation permease subunit